MALASPCHGQVIFPLKCVSQLLVTCVLIGSQCDRHCQPGCQTEHGTARSVALSSFAHVPWTQDMTIWFHWYPWYTIEIYLNSQLGQLSTNLRFPLQLSSTTKCLRGVGCCSPVQPLCQLETYASIVFFMHFIILLMHMPAILVPRQTPRAQRKLWRTQAPAYRLALTGHSLAPMQKSK